MSFYNVYPQLGSSISKVERTSYVTSYTICTHKRFSETSLSTVCTSVLNTDTFVNVNISWHKGKQLQIQYNLVNEQIN